MDSVNYRFELACNLLRLFIVAACAGVLPNIASAGQNADASQQETFLRKHLIAGDCIIFSAEPKHRDYEADVCKTYFPATQYSKEVDSSVLASLLTRSGEEKLRHPVVIDGASFRNRLSLRDADIPVELRLIDCEFEDAVDFSSAHFRGPLYLTGSTFRRPDLNFNSVRVIGGVNLDEVVVAGDAQFFHLSVAGNVLINKATFKPAAGKACFDANMPATGSACFGETEINGNIYILNSTFNGSLFITQSSLKGLQIEDTAVENLLDLSHTHIERVLAPGIRLGPNQKPPPPKILLTGLTYGDLEPGVDTQLKLLIRADPDDTQAYSQLEDYYRLHGLLEQADTVFIQRKEAERAKLSRSKKWFSFLVDYTVGYGRKPEYALYWSLGFVVLGALIFREADMVSEDPRSKHLTYNSFWYSLDLLTPLIDLDAAKVWVPSKNCWFKRNYARFHRIVGWILVPIGIAAITGIIK